MSLITGGGGSGAVSGVIVSGTAAAGQVPVASSSSAGAWAYPPGFEIGYDQVTAGVNIAGTTEGTATTLITCAAHTFDGGAVLVQWSCAMLRTGTTSGSTVTVALFESGTVINWLTQIQTPAAVADGTPGTGWTRFTPTAAAHTYTVGAFTSNATGTPTATAGAGGPGANPPMFVRFTKV